MFVTKVQILYSQKASFLRSNKAYINHSKTSEILSLACYVFTDYSKCAFCSVKLSVFLCVCMCVYVCVMSLPWNDQPHKSVTSSVGN